MKNQKGITLITLTITIVVMLILTFTMAVNIEPYKEKRVETNFKTDMQQLTEEINQYYARTKQIPIINKYTNVSMLEAIKNINDNDEYYVIDLKQLDVKLNYGLDYYTIAKKEQKEEITDLLDVYIINEQSNTIYYPKGIKYDNKVYYTTNQTYNNIKVEGYANKPELLEGMTPIKFNMPTDANMGTAVETTAKDNDWYEYGITYETRKWANAQTQDGSMWVWIPRYAYKIIYKDESDKSKGGTIDVKFLIGITDNYYDETGAIKTAIRQTTVEETIDATKDYVVHPAFTNESSIGYANGGWDKELTGFWVAKFEAGYASGNNTAPVVASNVKYTQTTSKVQAIESTTSKDAELSARNWLDGIYGENMTLIKYPTFQGTTYAMNYINHNDVYNISRALTNSGNIYGLNSNNADSHLMKNSEWGAVAYLSYSKYGTNGKEITINNANLNSGNRKRTETVGKSGVDSVYAVTGCTSNTTNTANNNTTIEAINSVKGNTANANGIYVWNQKTGQNASTTGTIYGIYDLSGGTWERNAGFVSNGNSNLLTYGKALLDETKVEYTNTVTANTGKSTKYVTIYPNNEKGATNTDTAGQNNFASNTKIYGDAIRETTGKNAGTSNTNWNISSWNSDYSYLPSLDVVFFIRGGNLWGNSGTGTFAFKGDSGSSNYICEFRAVLLAR